MEIEGIVANAKPHRHKAVWMKTPQPFPYQGSKRNLAAAILRYVPEGVQTLIEPFAGSAAFTLAAAANNLAEEFTLNDFNHPLIELWKNIIDTPEKLARKYESLWQAQHSDRRQFYDTVREKFNEDQQPEHLLYLLARCVKASVRYNAEGGFNQSPDNRRNGIIPGAMRKNLLASSMLLRGRTECLSVDYKKAVTRASTEDLVYMDPPYQGVCGERDPRYLKSVPFSDFVEVLETLNSRGISYLVSYDGRTGDKVHGRRLPSHLKLNLVELAAGRSSQATLLGRAENTVESLYLSKALEERLKGRRRRPQRQLEQLSLLEAQ
jgi:DNA adenine methylase